LNNTGLITANVTVRFIDVVDKTGATPGTVSSRDIPIRVNSGTPITDVIRWVLRDPSPTPSGKSGFLVITTPQPITAQAHIINSSSGDPVIPDQQATRNSASTPLILRFEPFGPGTPLVSSRIAISNPGASTAHAQLTAYYPSGSVGATLNVSVVGGGEFFTEDIVGVMGLPPIFQGWMTLASDSSVLVFNQRRSGDTGALVPVFAR